MATITAITLQHHDTSQCNISINNSYAFSLPALDVSSLGLRVGQELNELQVEELSAQATSSKSYRQALGYVAIRARSELEVRHYLQRKRFDAEDISRSIERLAESGLVNDLMFAQAWVRDRMALRPRSRRQLQQELQAKGISRDVIEAVIQEQGDDEQYHALVRLAEKKRRTYGTDLEKLTQYLLRQGYNYALVKRAVAAQAEEE